MNAVLILELLLKYADKVAALGSLITKSRAEGRDVSDAELAGLFANDDVAKAELQALIASKS